MTFKEPTLWKHQSDGFELAKDVPEFAFLFDVGTGKTLTAITVLRYKYTQAKRLLPTLILSPVITLDNWTEEWSKFSKVPRDRIVMLMGPVKKRIEKLQRALDKWGGDIIVITNYEALVASADFTLQLLNWAPNILLCDESHRCKTFNSKRTKAVALIADKTDFRYILTGTFVTNSPTDVFSQFRILDKGKSFGRNFYMFRNQYFYDKNANIPKIKFPDWKIRAGALEAMNKIIYKRAMKAIKEDCIDLPELVCKRVYVELTPEQTRHYKEMKKHLVTRLDDEVCVAEMALTKTLRLGQIVTGFMKTDEGNNIQLKNNREKVLGELLGDLTPTNKVIVWSVFHQNYEQIRRVCDKLKIAYREGHGLVPGNQKFENIKEFGEDPNIRVLIGNPAAIGIGINIHAAAVSIYYSRNYSLEHRLQSEARNYRGGSVKFHKKVTRIDMVTRDTIDELILQALELKLKTSEEILRFVRSGL